MIEASRNALKLVAQCEETIRLMSLPTERGGPPPNMMADVILQHRQLVEELRRATQREEGILDELRRIISLVAELLGATIASTNGLALWASELPPGKAPAFRRALNKIINYMRDVDPDEK